MSNTEEVKIQAESLLKILEETTIDGIVKRFYDASKTRVIPTIREMQTRYGYDQSLYMNRTTARSLILTVLGHTDDYDSSAKVLSYKYNDDTLIEDDVFCFAAQQHLVDLADSNGDENEIFEIKRFLIFLKKSFLRFISDSSDIIHQKVGYFVSAGISAAVAKTEFLSTVMRTLSAISTVTVVSLISRILP